MRFSLRSLFLLVTLLAGSLLAVSGYDGVSRDRSRVEKLNREIEERSQALLISDPQRHRALVHSLEHHLEDHATGNKKRGPIEIEFKVRIESVGPYVVAASEANVLYILKSPNQLRYVGQGKYAIETK
ncbi:MAG: hypothetical protein Q8M16_14200 [Pirellulaceae bacterium]|nr:hypothetical protein [Pirellulaceae bacterium]